MPAHGDCPHEGFSVVFSRQSYTARTDFGPCRVFRRFLPDTAGALPGLWCGSERFRGSSGSLQPPRRLHKPCTRSQGIEMRPVGLCPSRELLVNIVSSARAQATACPARAESGASITRAGGRWQGKILRSAVVLSWLLQVVSRYLCYSELSRFIRSNQFRIVLYRVRALALPFRERSSVGMSV